MVRLLAKLGLLAICIVPALVLAYALLAHLVLHGPVTADSLAVSVEGATGGGDAVFEPSCRRRERVRLWTCDVADDSGSGLGTYRVSVHEDSSCWMDASSCLAKVCRAT